MKKIYINPQTKIKEQAELLADMAARQGGYDRKSPKWKKMFQTVLEQRYTQSSIPFAENPRTAIIPDAVIDAYGFFFENNSPLNKGGSEHFKINKNTFKGATTALTQLYTELIMGLNKQSDFNIEANASKEQIHQKAENIYIRYFVFVTWLVLTELILTTPRSTMIENFRKLDFDKLSTDDLRKDNIRDEFVKQAAKALKQAFSEKLSTK